MAKTGYSFIELLFAVAALATVSSIAIPPFLTALDGYRAAGAVRYLSTRIHRARMEAVSRSTNAALQFIQTGTGYSFGLYVDGNGDGVRTPDIISGVDHRIGDLERLGDNFSNVDFGLLPDLPPVDAGSPAPGTDPIKLGAANLVSYSSTGSSSSGSLYIRGQGQIQYVIRILGDTGRTRVLKFEPPSRQWKAQ